MSAFVVEAPDPTEGVEQNVANITCFLSLRAFPFGLCAFSDECPRFVAALLNFFLVSWRNLLVDREDIMEKTRYARKSRRLRGGGQLRTR